jgi:DNA methylase
MKIFNCNVDDIMEKDWTADCIILDPPDNLGLKYDGYVDKRPDYYTWLNWIISLAMRKAPIVWVSYYHKHDIEIKRRLPSPGEARTFIWTYTFGQNRDSDCGNGYRPILRLSRPGFKFDTESIKVPSWREENGDKRAAPGGRVPLDVWDFPRVGGNVPERRSWHPTQHPEALYIRILKMSGCLKPGPWKVVDLFAGTGTVFRAARALQAKNPEIDAVGVEQSKLYCRYMAAENPGSATPSARFGL